MTRFLRRRLGTSLIVLFGVSVITFVLARVIPSNPAALYIGPRARPDDIARVSAQLGLDRPLPEQYLTYMGDMLTGDWGTSIGTKRPVLDEIVARLPATLELLVVAMLVAVFGGILLGVIAANWRARLPDGIVRVTSIVGVSIPAFFLGLLLQIAFFRWLGILPLSGRLDVDLRFVSPIAEITGLYLVDSVLTGNWVAFGDAAAHLVLPALTLAAYPIGLIARMTRTTMVETLAQDHIRTATAYGLPRRTIVGRLALRNALPPVVTVIGLTIAYSLTGAFFVELVFNWPGLGQFAVNAFLNVDYPVIMGVTLFGAVAYVVMNVLVDLGHAWLDPRVRLG